MQVGRLSAHFQNVPSPNKSQSGKMLQSHATMRVILGAERAWKNTRLVGVMGEEEHREREETHLHSARSTAAERIMIK